MFRIADGRDHFYQWDLDRQVILEDKSIVQAHFCNRTDECSLVTEVVNGVANVPNILLQNSFDIRVFAYDGKATLHEKTFKVKPRTKPSDYVYTETTLVTLYDVLERAEEAVTNATKASEDATQALTQANAALEAAIEATSRVETAVDESEANATTSRNAAEETSQHLAEVKVATARAEEIEVSITQSKEYVDQVVEGIDEKVQEAITNNPEMVDTVTIDVSNAAVNTTAIVQKTDDLGRFIQSVLAGKDVLAFLKVARGSESEVFLATVELRDNGTQYLIFLTGTPYYTSGSAYDPDEKYEYSVQIVYIKETSSWSAYAYKADLRAFATEEYVDNAIANIEIPVGPGGNVDLSDYYTKAETDALLENIEAGEVDLSEYAKKTQLDNYVKKVDFDEWERDFVAELDQEYASKGYVANAINTAFAGIATAEGGSY